jgi:hypothetical protein
MDTLRGYREVLRTSLKAYQGICPDIDYVIRDYGDDLTFFRVESDALLCHPGLVKWLRTIVEITEGPTPVGVCREYPNPQKLANLWMDLMDIPRYNRDIKTVLDIMTCVVGADMPP